MTATTEDRKTSYREGIELEFPVKASTKIPAGVLVCVDSTGYAVNAANTAGYIFVGVSAREANNSSGNNGDINVQVRTEGVFEFGASSIAITSVGADMYVVDNQTFDETDPGQGIKCGKLVKYVSATKGWIKVGRAVATNYTGSGDALTVSDAGDYFPAATNTLAEQVQALAAVPMVITFPTFTGWIKDGSAHNIALPALELPVPVRIRRAYVALGSAPGAGYTLALTLNTNALVSIAGTATTGEAESLDLAIAANTDLVIAANETASGSGANAQVILVAVLDDGE